MKRRTFIKRLAGLPLIGGLFALKPTEVPNPGPTYPGGEAKVSSLPNRYQIFRNPKGEVFVPKTGEWELYDCERHEEYVYEKQDRRLCCLDGSDTLFIVPPTNLNVKKYRCVIMEQLGPTPSNIDGTAAVSKLIPAGVWDEVKV